MLTAFLCFSEAGKALLKALQWSVMGGVLAALGWAAAPSLGKLILASVPRVAPSASVHDEEAYLYSTYLIWQTGMGFVMGFVFAREKPMADVPVNSIG